MKKDIDSLMQAHNLGALLVVGPGQNNPPMVYLTGGAHLTNAYLIKKRGQVPLLYHASTERDEAARTGLAAKNLDIFRMDQLIEQHNGDMLSASVALLQLLFEDAGLTSGRVAVAGKSDAGQAYAVLTALQAALPGLELVGETGDSVLLSAMATKEPAEVERIRQMGRITTAVVGQVADYLTSQRVKDEVLVKPDGTPLTIGEVKNLINLWLAERGAANPEGTIFAMGYDAAVPHSAGTPAEALRLGQTIIFDIYPCEPGGGYFYDFTRTWCLGYAPDEALALHEDVLQVYRQVTSEMRPGTPFKNYSHRVCELFEARGHASIKSNSVTQEGLVHSVGHGVGLHVHERPFSRFTTSDEERLDPGVVFTVEPGLYYPDQK